ncbi:hypothetical protein DERP_008096 [Dermatophagoides pteronyssinus]|uniref:Uncharacterized protein n=1 Tax=Dermatophagoides pteronyssinus TaxID=6956 RepID=A0ABQ8JJQ7_DERPT|nr:hypothetical protein DERP_008096 [Dermatophagoides pteronyssinus]
MIANLKFKFKKREFEIEKEIRFRKSVWNFGRSFCIDSIARSKNYINRFGKLRKMGSKMDLKFIICKYQMINRFRIFIIFPPTLTSEYQQVDHDHG